MFLTDPPPPLSKFPSTSATTDLQSGSGLSQVAINQVAISGGDKRERSHALLWPAPSRGWDTAGVGRNSRWAKKKISYIATKPLRPAPLVAIVKVLLVPTHPTP